MDSVQDSTQVSVDKQALKGAHYKYLRCVLYHFSRSIISRGSEYEASRIGASMARTIDSHDDEATIELKITDSSLVKEIVTYYLRLRQLVLAVMLQF